MQIRDEASPSISPASRGQSVQMLTTLEAHGIFGLNFAYLYILTLSSQSVGRASLSDGHGLLVTMLITLEPRGIL